MRRIEAETLDVGNVEGHEATIGDSGYPKLQADEVRPEQTQIDGVEINKVEADHGRDHVYTPFAQPTEIRVVLLMPSIDFDAPITFSFHQSCLWDLQTCQQSSRSAA